MIFAPISCHGDPSAPGGAHTTLTGVCARLLPPPFRIPHSTLCASYTMMSSTTGLLTRSLMLTPSLPLVTINSTAGFGPNHGRGVGHSSISFLTLASTLLCLTKTCSPVNSPDCQRAIPRSARGRCGSATEAPRTRNRRPPPRQASASGGPKIRYQSGILMEGRGGGIPKP
jgi:hypothetical protein